MIVACFLLCLASGEKPVLREDSGNLLVTLSQELLDDDATRRRLLSGLTLSIQLETRLQSSGMKKNHQALITVRYEVWEERIQVQVADGVGDVFSTTVPDLNALFAWFNGQPIKLAPLARSSYPIKVRLDCTVIPYSADEAQQTRDWFSQKLKVARAGERGLVGGEGVSNPSGSSVFEVLMSSGIRARPLRTYRWKWLLAGGRQ